MAGRVVVDLSTSRPFRTLAAGTLSISLGALPVFLLGAMAVLIREELSFGEVALGAVASAYYGASAALSIPGGSIAERLGARRAMAVAAAITLVSMLGVASSRSIWVIGLFMVSAGVANGIALPASNLALARGIPVRRQGVAFGLKQSSGPIATLVAGAALPLIGLTVGWRTAFVLAGLAGLPLIVFGFRRQSSAGPTVRGQLLAPHRRALIVLACAATLAVVGGSSLAAFYVSSAVAFGVAPAAAGGLLSVGSLFGIAGRVGWGYLGDRDRSHHVAMLTAIMSLGAIGYVLLGAVRGPWSLAGATLVTFTSGWAWPGLFHFALILRSPTAPGAATGLVGTGLFSGGIVGPLAFGWVVENAGYQAAWNGVALAALGAAAFMYVGGRKLEKAAQ